MIEDDFAETENIYYCQACYISFAIGADPVPTGPCDPVLVDDPGSAVNERLTADDLRVLLHCLERERLHGETVYQRACADLAAQRFDNAVANVDACLDATPPRLIQPLRAKLERLRFTAARAEDRARSAKYRNRDR